MNRECLFLFLFFLFLFICVFACFVCFCLWRLSGRETLVFPSTPCSPHIDYGCPSDHFKSFPSKVLSQFLTVWLRRLPLTPNFSTQRKKMPRSLSNSITVRSWPLLGPIRVLRSAFVTFDATFWFLVMKVPPMSLHSMIRSMLWNYILSPA